MIAIGVGFDRAEPAGPIVAVLFVLVAERSALGNWRARFVDDQIAVVVDPLSQPRVVELIEIVFDEPVALAHAQIVGVLDNASPHAPIIEVPPAAVVPRADPGQLVLDAAKRMGPGVEPLLETRLEALGRHADVVFTPDADVAWDVEFLAPTFRYRADVDDSQPFDLRNAALAQRLDDAKVTLVVTRVPNRIVEQLESAFDRGHVDQRKVVLIEPFGPDAIFLAVAQSMGHGRVEMEPIAGDSLGQVFEFLSQRLEIETSLFRLDVAPKDGDVQQLIAREAAPLTSREDKPRVGHGLDSRRQRPVPPFDDVVFRSPRHQTDEVVLRGTPLQYGRSHQLVAKYLLGRGPARIDRRPIRRMRWAGEE